MIIEIYKFLINCKVITIRKIYIVEVFRKIMINDYFEIRTIADPDLVERTLSDFGCRKEEVSLPLMRIFGGRGVVVSVDPRPGDKSYDEIFGNSPEYVENAQTRISINNIFTWQFLGRDLSLRTNWSGEIWANTNLAFDVLGKLNEEGFRSHLYKVSEELNLKNRRTKYEARTLAR